MRVPDFKTEAEARGFWGKHSIGDYWKDLRESGDTFGRPKLTPVLKFDPIVLKKIKMLAKKRGAYPTTHTSGISWPGVWKTRSTSRPYRRSDAGGMFRGRSFLLLTP